MRAPGQRTEGARVPELGTEGSRVPEAGTSVGEELAAAVPGTEQEPDLAEAGPGAAPDVGGRDGIGLDGSGLKGTGQGAGPDGIGLDGSGPDGTGQRAGPDGIGLDGSGPDDSEQNGSEPDTGAGSRPDRRPAEGPDGAEVLAVAETVPAGRSCASRRICWHCSFTAACPWRCSARGS